MGSRSGIEIDDTCVTAFNKLKLAKNIRYTSFKMSNDLKKIIVEKEVHKAGDNEDQYKEFVAQLPQNEARYFIYDFEFRNPDGDIRNKVALILWCPDACLTKTNALHNQQRRFEEETRWNPS
eukprot:TRINITY_DN13591_c0_g1_i1.p1 TRINITY_DN13591_c0_g1~~TRINITY_DN13591_c0_g1_i1.p1  ORF type:complete len:122 (+),score=25.30 TRINITY_DN13591_c0_g1_i1:116-481(+)